MEAHARTQRFFNTRRYGKAQSEFGPSVRHEGHKFGHAAVFGAAKRCIQYLDDFFSTSTFTIFGCHA